MRERRDGDATGAADDAVPTTVTNVTDATDATGATTAIDATDAPTVSVSEPEGSSPASDDGDV